MRFLQNDCEDLTETWVANVAHSKRWPLKIRLKPISPHAEYHVTFERSTGGEHQEVLARYYGSNSLIYLN